MTTPISHAGIAPDATLPWADIVYVITVDDVAEFYENSYRPDHDYQDGTSGLPVTWWELRPELRARILDKLRDSACNDESWNTMCAEACDEVLLDLDEVTRVPVHTEPHFEFEDGDTMTCADLAKLEQAESGGLGWGALYDPETGLRCLLGVLTDVDDEGREARKLVRAGSLCNALAERYVLQLNDDTPRELDPHTRAAVLIDALRHHRGAPWAAPCS